MSLPTNSAPLTMNLPFPWIHGGMIHRDNWSQLEQAVGLELDPDESAYARWDELRNTDTELRALIRVHLPRQGSDLATISAVLFASDPPGSPVKASALRDFPLAAVSQAYVNYEYQAMNFTNLELSHDELFDPEQSIGRPTKGDSHFYVRLAVQYLHFQETDHDPTQHIADLSNAPRATVKRWLSDARRKGLLPPGKPGRLARGSSDGHR